ncbi:MAG: adenylosuccinate lyase [Verrucomicrobia bacterium]|nr:MAG: adenylosuccinate lyase [Verrucomicrobiota bacterium]
MSSPTDPSAAPIPNVLAERYASPLIKGIWSPTGRIAIERDYWIAVMKAQRELGLAISAKAIAAYEKVKGVIDLADIDARERVTLHDVKARIEAFNALAGHECIHLGLTSRDLTENVEQLQIARSLAVVQLKSAAALGKLAVRAKEFRTLMLTGRTHNVPAQPTTLGKRFAMFGEEILAAYTRIAELAARYPVRGLKGAVGTQLDQFTLFEGDAAKVAALERGIVKHLGFGGALGSVGQVYPRSLDFEVVSALHQLGAGAASFATTLRLMAGQGLLTEGFQKGQVGSSAMPHKVNARNCERICGFSTILSGYVTMTGALAGHQWNEGDVSCSVVRRVALPDAFFAIDGLLETLLAVLNQMDVFSAAIAAENQRQLPFLATTTILMEAVKAGVGREAAHLAIKENALAAAKALRTGAGDSDLVRLLAVDPRLGLPEAKLRAILADGKRFVGAAPQQVDTFTKTVAAVLKQTPGAARYEPGKLL